MFDVFSLTLFAVVLSSLLVAYIRRRKVDVCLKDMNGDSIRIYLADGSVLNGVMRAISTGMELRYRDARNDTTGNPVTTHLLYKSEYSGIEMIERVRRTLSESEQRRRDKMFRRIHHPRLFRRLGRSIKNFFKTIRDSLSEITNMVIGQTTQRLGVPSALTAQTKYINQVNNELISTVGTAFEELLENYIGHEVSVSVTTDKDFPVVRGILKDYTAEFLELWDVKRVIDGAPAIADIVLPRRIAVVRHLAEERVD